jgi:hypothetical protein
MESSNFDLPIIDFKTMSIDSDLVFDKIAYMPNISISEEIFRCQKVQLNNIITEVKKLLVSIMNYLKENHINMKNMYESQQNLLEKLQRLITYLDSESMYEIFNNFNTEMEKEYLIRFINYELLYIIKY